MITTIVKQPGETLRPAIGFDTLSPITAVNSVTSVARGLVIGAAPLTASATIAAGLVTAQLGGGSDGERYLVTIRASDGISEILESEIEVAVIEGTWALPDGGTPYLSIAAFVKRFTLEETVRMTDSTGAGRIDRELLIGALADAQAIADAHLAGRYAVPLAAVPAVIEMAIADIARARLYPRGAPDGVAEAARDATKLLERVRDGNLTLPIAGTTPAEAPSSNPVLIAPGRRQYPDGLDDY